MLATIWTKTRCRRFERKELLQFMSLLDEVVQVQWRRCSNCAGYLRYVSQRDPDGNWENRVSKSRARAQLTHASRVISVVESDPFWRCFWLESGHIAPAQSSDSESESEHLPPSLLGLPPRAWENERLGQLPAKALHDRYKFKEI